MARTYCFPLGTPLRRAERILPIFLPFAGCPQACAFCAQDRQTGTSAVRSEQGIENALVLARHALHHLHALSCPPSCELAFYGGTFTALPSEQRHACLCLFKEAQEAGMVQYGRCSTRPDSLSREVLNELQAVGLDMVELGIQSFDDSALALAQRGYGGKDAFNSCIQVQEAGFKLGIQLLPGMPGVTPALFLEDVKKALLLKPAALRLYPCLVPEGTLLAQMWREGRYVPWNLEETIQTMGIALALAWQAQVPVIRLSVAPEADFDATLLAGPRHPALGNMVQAAALQQTVHKHLQDKDRNARQLALPRTCQGFLYGHKGVLKSWWTKAGLPPERITFHAEAHACLYF